MKPLQNNDDNNYNNNYNNHNNNNNNNSNNNSNNDNNDNSDNLSVVDSSVRDNPSATDATGPRNGRPLPPDSTSFPDTVTRKTPSRNFQFSVAASRIMAEHNIDPLEMACLQQQHIPASSHKRKLSSNLGLHQIVAVNPTNWSDHCMVVADKNGSAAKNQLQPDIRECLSSTKNDIVNNKNKHNVNSDAHNVDHDGDKENEDLKLCHSAKRVKMISTDDSTSVAGATSSTNSSPSTHTEEGQRKIPACPMSSSEMELSGNEATSLLYYERLQQEKKEDSSYRRISAQSMICSTTLNNNNPTSFSHDTLLSIVKSSTPNLHLAMRMMSPLYLFSSPSGCCGNCCTSATNADGDGDHTNVSAINDYTNSKDKQHSTTALRTNSITPTINDTMASLFQSYYNACGLYNCEPNPGVLVAIRYSLPSLRVSGSFHDADMLALSEVLITYMNTPLLSHIKRLDFARASQEGKLHGIKGFKSHGAFALSRVLLTSQHITEVFLQRHKIGPYGAAAIFAACQENPTVKVLVLRRCLLGVRGAQAFAQCIVHPTSKCGLREVDLSNCRMGFHGTNAVCKALLKREQRGLPPIDVDIEGNLIFQEIMNSVTHGLGIFFAIIGTIALSERTKGQPLRSVVSCSIYSISLLFLYTCSTLFHSFFALRTVHLIFGIIDKCAIYILIAGSYTPYLAISLADEPYWSVYLLSFIWMCCFLGIYVAAFHQSWKYKGKFSLAMYLGMGWACMVCVPDLIAAIPRNATILLVLGGVGYTTGVPFFVRNTNLDHSIWHIFVLAASMCHWFGVYSYIALL